MARSDGSIDQVINSPKVDAQLDKLYERLQKVVDIIGVINKAGKGIDFSKGFTDASRAAQEARAATEELRRAKADLARQEQELRNAITQSKLEAQRERTERERLKTSIDREKQARKEADAARRGEKGSIRDLQRTLSELRKQYDLLGPAARKAFDGKQILREIDRVDKQYKKLMATTGRRQPNVGNYPHIVGGLSSFAGAFGVTFAAGAIAKQVYDTTVQLDSLNAVLKAVSGSEEEFARNQTFLVEISDRLGLNILNLTESYKGFYTASTLSGVSADETRKIFESVATAGAKLRLSNEQVNGAFLALQQMISKGTVQAEELRGQLAERIPGAFKIAADAIGVTEQQLNKLLKNGEVVAKDFLPKFAAELRKRFGQDGEVEGLRASINRLSNSFTELISDNQSGLSRFFGLIVDGARKGVEALNSVASSVGYLYDKVFNPSAAKKTIQDRTLDDYTKSLSGKSLDDLLADRNKLDENLSAEGDRLDRIRSNDQTIKNASKNPRALISAEVYNRSEALLKSQEDRVKFLKRQREILVNAIKTQLNPSDFGPNNEAGNGPGKDPTKDELNAAARLRERQRKALLDSQNIDLDTAIASQKEIIENDKAGFQLRLDALANYYDLKEQKINEELESEKKKEKLLPEEIANLEKSAQKKRLDNRREFWKEYADLAKSGADLETKAVLEALDKKEEEINKQENEELKSAVKKYQAGILTEEQYELLSLQIKNKYDNIRIKAQIEYSKKILDIQEAAGIDVTEQRRKIYDLEQKLENANIDYFFKKKKKEVEIAEDAAKKKLEAEKRLQEGIQELITESTAAIGAIFQGRIEREKNLIQEQIDERTKQTEQEIEAVNRSSATEQEKADKIQIINARAQAQREALEARQRQLEQQRARFERAQSIAGVVQNTAVGIMKTFSEFPFPVALPISLVIGGIGLAQIAQIVARPIPKYKDGVESHPFDGLAEVGDGGRHEVLVAPDGDIQVSPDRPTRTWMKKGTRVFPSIKDFLMDNPGFVFRQPPDGSGRSSDSTHFDRVVGAIQSEVGALAREIRNKPSERTIIDEAGIRHQVWNGMAWNTYINKYVRGR